jgi:hypothetical protein
VGPDGIRRPIGNRPASFHPSGGAQRHLSVGLSFGRQSCLQAAFQAAFSVRDEFLGLRCKMPARHEAGENTGELRE